MTSEQFMANFGHIANAPGGVGRLRDLIYYFAFAGELVAHSRETAAELAEALAETVSPTGRNRRAMLEPAAGFYPIPPHWLWVNIGDVGHDWGQTKPSEDFTYIDVSAIDNHRGVVAEGASIVSAANAPSRARKVVKRGTVIYSTVRPYLLNIAVIERDFTPPPIASTAFAILHPHDGVEAKFVYYFLRSPAFVAYVEGVQSGIAYPAISDQKFFAASFPLAPTEEQKRIVAKVDELMALCDQLEAQQQERKRRFPVLSRTCHSPSDRRRVRCAMVAILRRAANDGDSLLSLAECQDRLEKLDTKHPIQITTDWLRGHADFVANRVRYEVLSPDGDAINDVETLQLVELADREQRLRKVLLARALKVVPSLEVDWQALLVSAIRKSGNDLDETNERHRDALAEQSTALENITTRRLSVLIGQAGTGKTSIVGALVECAPLIQEGILLLAPTGKARVRLSGATGAEAMTVAQLLYHLGRYDGARQRSRFDSEGIQADKFNRAKTVVIDEASMLTMDMLQAILEGLDLTHITRIILVGDPNQLPPIGVGRPFVDLVCQLENSPELDGKPSPKGAVGRLRIEVRTKAGAPSDALRLASWFTNQPVGGDAERVLSEVGDRLEFNDLEIAFWKTPDDLRNSLLAQFQKHLGLSGPDDMDGFNAALGFVDGNVSFADPDGIENFQILSPEKAHPYGVHDLNRWIQSTFRAKELRGAREFFKTSIGDENIVIRDKVIQLSTRKMEGYNWVTRGTEEHYIANGDIGGVGPGKGGFLNVAFAGKPNVTFGYRGKDFKEDSSPLELAYVLTIHKAQGSQFGTVFVVLPKASRLLSRELLYTSLTRSRERLVLLIEGDSAGALHELSKVPR